MNERIKELAREAEFGERDLHIQGDNFQRFAELVVRDICNKLEPVLSQEILEYYGVE